MEKLLKLIDCTKYNQEDLDILVGSFNFAKKFTQSSFSISYSTAMTLAKLKMDIPSIATALLYESLKDSLADSSVINEFNKDVGFLFNNVVNISKQINLAENNINLLNKLSNMKDIRVVIIKIVDHLHHIRKIENRNNKKLAKQSLEVFSPLADILGMQEIKDEIEDLAFEALHHTERQEVLQKINSFYAGHELLVSRIIIELQGILNKLSAEISGRVKTPYSIWSKKNKDFDDLMDIMAFRVIVNEVNACYAALGIIHTTFQAIFNRFKDYISTPKTNGYKSIHTCVLGPSLHPIEIQIRTREMHEAATNGVYAHWLYKRNDLMQLNVLEKMPQKLNLSEVSNPIVIDQVFCFAANGELIILPKGATVLDFAYATNNGNTCIGAKIDGKRASLKEVVTSGARIEIVSSSTQFPKADWLSWIITEKAKKSISEFLEHNKKEEEIEMGKCITKQLIENMSLEFDESIITKSLNLFNHKKIEDFYIAVSNKLPANFSDIMNNILNKNNSINLSHALISKFNCVFSKCCNPKPGNEISGVYIPNDGLYIHTENCKNKQQGINLRFSWSELPESIRFSIALINKPGILPKFAKSILDLNLKIKSLKLNQKKKSSYEALLDLEISKGKAEYVKYYLLENLIASGIKEIKEN